MRVLRKLRLAAPLLVIAAAAASAQSGPTARAPLYDPQQMPRVDGVVQQFTLTPRGDIDGVILADGTEVKTPPHLSSEIANAVRPGDTVTFHGLRAAALPLVQAASLTDARTGETVVDNGPPGPGRRPPPPPPPSRAPSPPPPAGASARDETLVQGRVRMHLHGPMGDVDGVLLDSGVILRLPPPDAARLQTLLNPGQSLTARGVDLKSALGSVVDVEEIGETPGKLSPVRSGPDQDPPPPPLPPRG